MHLETKPSEINKPETKIIFFENKKIEKKQKENENKITETTKEKRKRIITNTNTWNHCFQNKEIDFCNENQLSILQLLLINKTEDSKIHFLREQIRQKINNYRFQDINKNLYDSKSFITLEYILYKLNECNLNCFYCLEPVYIWYEIAREPKQWTVERIDNKFGHNIGNIEIACLSCNLKRRCMYHERYIFTKQIKIVKNEKQT